MFRRYACALLALALAFVALPLAGQRRDVRSNEGSLVMAVQFFHDGAFQDAASQCRLILGRDSSYDAAHYYLGLCEAYLGDLEEAELHLSEAVRIDSTNYWYRQRLAQLYQALDRIPDAIGVYEGIKRDFPRRSETYGSLAELYAHAGRLDDALVMLDRIDTLMGVGDASAMMRFRIYGQTGRMQEAYDFFESVEPELGSPQIKCILGEYNLSMSRDSAAFALYDEAIAIAPDYAPALLGKAEAFRTTRRDDEYFDILDSFVRNPEFDVEMKCDYLRQVYQHSDSRFMASCGGRLSDAVEAVSKTHPDSSGAALLAAGVLFSTDDYEALLDFALECSARFPDEDDFPELASFSAYQLGRYETVIEMERGILARALAAHDAAGASSAYGNIGDMYHSLGDSKKAYRAYRDALKLNPDNIPALNNYAYYLSLEGRKLSMAARMSRKTIDKEPDNATYLDTYGWILHLQGKDEEALSVFKRAMIYGGKDSATMLRHYADVLDANGKHDLAQMYRRQADGKKE